MHGKSGISTLFVSPDHFDYGGLLDYALCEIGLRTVYTDCGYFICVVIFAVSCLQKIPGDPIFVCNQMKNITETPLKGKITK